MCASGDLLSSLATGVGQNPSPVSPVRGTDGCSRNNDRPAGVAEAFQVSQHVVEAHRDDASNVLSQDVGRSALVNDAAHLRPEMAVIFRAHALPGVRPGLTGEPSGEEVEGGLFAQLPGSRSRMEGAM